VVAELRKRGRSPRSSRAAGVGARLFRGSLPAHCATGLRKKRRDQITAPPTERDTERAMSQENVELARRAIDALNRGDHDYLLACLSPDVVWGTLEGIPGMDELYRGWAGVREWTELMSEVTEEGIYAEIERITDLGDERVFIAVALTARGRGSGLPWEYRTWQIVWFSDGLITRRQVFWTRDEALEAAGLSE
jgi:ketosteroid isomerase-like protein